MQRKIQIWVDADACPNAIKDILYRVAERVGIKVRLIANAPLTVPRSGFIEHVVVAAGFDVADNYIVQRVIDGDIVITADIPLAAEVIARGATAINPRGERYTSDNIRQRLQIRDAMEQLRSSGIQTGGPPPFSQRDRQQFANQLDRLLAGKKLSGRL